MFDSNGNDRMKKNSQNYVYRATTLHNDIHKSICNI